MYRSCKYLAIALAVILYASLAHAAGVCTGYPKMYNGKPCASTTRYYDGNMGACGCGTGNNSPASWQWTKPTAAASAPVFGTGTWCGSGCGKCYKLTPTAVGASVEGTGAPKLTSLVVKITNLCPYAGNEAWCAYDTNSHGYDAHFDLMDYNMNGIITQMGWNNPEVIYEEVDCAANGYTDWNCQCASGSSGSGATAAPATAPDVPVKDTPVEETPVEETPVEDTPAEAPVEDAPVEEAPVEEEPVEEAPVEEAPVEEAPVEEEPVEEAPVEEEPVEEEPVEEAPVEDEPVEDAPVEEEPTEEEPVEEPVEDAPVEDEPVEDAPVEDAPVEDEPAEDTPVEDEPVEEAPVEDAPTEHVKFQMNGGSNNWWVGFSLVYPDVSTIDYVEVKDSSDSAAWMRTVYQGNEWWNMYSVNPSVQFVLPLSVRITSTSGKTVTSENIITSFQATTVDTGVAV